MSNHIRGHRAAKTPPAVKQDAQPAFTGTINTYAQIKGLRLPARIEQAEYYVEQVLALSPEEYERLSAAAKLSHRIRMDDLAEMKQELAALEAAGANHEEGVIQ